ncbi:MAG: DUF1987 domain-containing protein [Bacteroidetes bacterium]|nr:MAG: DUF1987 domain-containing protein [Bacteroidota bacterium]
MANKTLENLDIEGKSSTFFVPAVHFDAQTGICRLEGESYLENTWEFYDQLTNWLKTYIELRKPINFNFKLTYFNTSSSKGLLDILFLLKEYEKDGGEVIANWYYPADDEDNYMEAQDFIADSELNMNLIAY